jgi:hypothetical protein
LLTRAAVDATAPPDLAVEVIRTVPASGNLTLSGQQFWLGLVLRFACPLDFGSCDTTQAADRLAAADLWGRSR